MSLGMKDIQRLQSVHKISENTSTEKGITFQAYLENCRKFVTENLNRKRGGSDAKSDAILMQELISEFVTTQNVKVDGYSVENEDGTGSAVVDNALLLADLSDTITGAGVLREALEDEEVDEIQINDPYSIFIQKNGTLVPYIDSKGRYVRFANNDEVETALSRLTNDLSGNTPKVAEGRPILNTRTAEEGYRVNAVHHTAVARDKAPFNQPATVVTIRKYKEIKLTIAQLIAFNTLNEEMARLIQLCGKAGLNVAVVGPVGSGKTTTLNIITRELPIDLRIGLVQNPTEITLFDRDESGRNRRNVIHMEVTEFLDLDDTLLASLPSLTSNFLRQTPDIIVLGESRDPREFQQAVRIMKAGSPVLLTYHSGTAEEAVNRFAEEVGGTPADLKRVADALDVVIVQHRANDGSRHVMSITEVCGVDIHGNLVLNPLYQFKLTGKKKINPKNGRNGLDGVYTKVGNLSDELTSKFYKASIYREELDGFIKPQQT